MVFFLLHVFLHFYFIFVFCCNSPLGFCLDPHPTPFGQIHQFVYSSPPKHFIFVRFFLCSCEQRTPLHTLPTAAATGSWGPGPLFEPRPEVTAMVVGVVVVVKVVAAVPRLIAQEVWWWWWWCI